MRFGVYYSHMKKRTEKWFATNPVIILLRHEWEYAGPNRPYVVLYMLMSLAANLIVLLTPVLISRAINAVQFEADNPDLLSMVILNLSLTVAVTLAFWLFHGFSRIIEKWNAFEVRKNFKTTMISRVLDLPARWHQDHHSGDTIDKINKASNALFNFSESSFQIISNLVALFGSIGAILYFDPRSSGIALVAALLTVSIIFLFDKKLIEGWREEYRFENHLAAAIHDYISNIRTIITLRVKARVLKEISLRSDAGLPQFQSNNKLNELKWFLASLFISLMTAFALSLNAYISYTTTGVIVVGTLFALHQYLYQVGETFYQFAWKYSDLVQQSTALLSVSPITEAFARIGERGSAKLPDGWQRIEIKDLLFDYNDEAGRALDAHHLQNISLEIRRGARLAFVGESGSGKSTTLALLRGLYPPKSVRVEADGKIMKKGLRHIYDYVTLVPQDPEIFNSTVEDNITMETAVKPEELHTVIDLARFRSVLERLPKGLQTNVLEKGVSLSGGEKQRLALARGILAAKNSPLLLMDEPTSSVDAVNERAIYENIFREFKEKTIIATIHRLHLLPYFDRVYFFSRGRIIAEGTLNELLLHPDFKTLWDRYHDSKESEA